MTRRALLLAACAVFVPGAAVAAPRRRFYRVRPRKPVAPQPGTVEPQSRTVRTIRLDSNWDAHPTFEQRWAGEVKP